MDVPGATAAGTPRGGGPVITLIAAGIGFILIVAIVVGIVDALMAPARRRVAVERRESWESRRPQFHGIDPHDAGPSRDDD